MLQQLANKIGIPADKLQNIMSQAQNMIGGVDQSDDAQVRKFLQDQDITASAIDNILSNPKVKGLLGMARMGKAMGVPALKNVDIDGMVNTARQFAGGQPTYSNPSYSVREQTYDKQKGIETLADKLPR